MVATKEFEALQTVSAFFAHDLKNAASTLSLMLTNLPVHFNDPSFRDDALRAIRNTVERINQLISRAAKLQSGLTLNRAETDLNALLSDSIQQLDHSNGVRWIERFTPLPKLPADREQLQSVVMNLLLNAQEAVGEAGTVTIETRASDEWAEFRVSDTGCGMSPEFLRSALFRPLQTTKKKGLGIGMFQSRMIVDAHRGKISAVSEAGSRHHFSRPVTVTMKEERKPKLLLVDDDEEIRTQMKWALGGEYEMCMAGDRAEAVQVFGRERPRLVLLDLGLPPKANEPEEGLAALDEILSVDGFAKIIIISGQGEKQNAIQAVGAGAYDFLVKPIEMDEVKLLLRRALHVADLEHEHRRLREQTQAEGFEGMVGASPQMHEVFAYIRKVAATTAPVLLLGESGTGKELAALAVHQRSPRKDGPFVAINCNGIPETLLESELFGHEKGAFTGAHVQRKGLIESAAGGTLFLDEVGELPPPIQVKLLRFLQEQTVQRIGGRQAIAIDTRVVAATNADLQDGIREGRFREDLIFSAGGYRHPTSPTPRTGRRRRSPRHCLPASLHGADGKKANGICSGRAPRALPASVAWQRARVTEPGKKGCHYGGGEATNCGGPRANGWHRKLTRHFEGGEGSDRKGDCHSCPHPTPGENYLGCGRPGDQSPHSLRTNG